MQIRCANSKIDGPDGLKRPSFRTFSHPPGPRLPRVARLAKRLQIFRIESFRIGSSTKGNDVIDVGRQSDLIAHRARATQLVLGLLYEPGAQALPVLVIPAGGPAPSCLARVEWAAGPPRPHQGDTERYGAGTERGAGTPPPLATPAPPSMTRRHITPVPGPRSDGDRRCWPSSSLTPQPTPRGAYFLQPDRTPATRLRSRCRQRADASLSTRETLRGCRFRACASRLLHSAEWRGNVDLRP